MKKLVAPISIALGLAGVLLAGFFVSAHAAAAAAPDDGNMLDMARPIFDEIMKGHFIASAALALVLSVALLKRYAPGKLGTFVHSDAGGSLSTLLMSFGGALATATVGGAPWTWGMMWTATTIAVTAAGGYVMFKKLIVEPILKPLSKKTPAWMQPIWSILFFLFDKKVNDLEAAQKAGDAAVAAQPATGVVPPATDI